MHRLNVALMFLGKVGKRLFYHLLVFYFVCFPVRLSPKLAPALMNPRLVRFSCPAVLSAASVFLPDALRVQIEARSDLLCIIHLAMFSSRQCRVTIPSDAQEFRALPTCLL
jgi:hypothetical protein